MTTEATEVPAAPPPPKKNVFARIAGVLFAPADAFVEIVRRPDVVGPLLLFVVISYACTAVLATHLDIEAMKAAQAEQMHKRNPNMSAADVERMGRFAEAGARVFIWLAPLFGIVFLAIAAGVLLLAFRAMGGEGNYHQSMSVLVYAWMPLVLSSILTAVIVAARGSFDPVTAAALVKSNPAFLVEMRDHPVLFSFLSSLDVFTIWTVILLTFGYAAMSRLSRGKSAAIVLGLWFLMILIKLGFAAMQA